MKLDDFEFEFGTLNMMSYKKYANKVTMLFHHNESHLLKAKVVKMVF